MCVEVAEALALLRVCVDVAGLHLYRPVVELSRPPVRRGLMEVQLPQSPVGGGLRLALCLALTLECAHHALLGAKKACCCRVLRLLPLRHAIKIPDGLDGQSSPTAE